jgi:hypothetical protein
VPLLHVVDAEEELKACPRFPQKYHSSEFAGTMQPIPGETPTKIVGDAFSFRGPDTAGRFAIFDLSPCNLQTNPPSKTSISCGLP